MYNMIDVSEHQSKIDFTALYDSKSIDFIMLRGGCGRNNIDKTFLYNASQCEKYEIPFGVYWFSYAYTVDMAKKEAEYCLALIKDFNVQLPVAFDFEYDSVSYANKKGYTITKELVSDMIKAFCSTIESGGYYAMVYANSDYITKYFTNDILSLYDLWFAAWPNTVNKEKPPRSCGIWQYSSKGKVSGITGNVDMNVVYKNYPSIINGMKESEQMTKDEAMKIVKEKAGLDDSTIQFIANDYRYGDELIIKLAMAMQ